MTYKAFDNDDTSYIEISDHDRGEGMVVDIFIEDSEGDEVMVGMGAEESQRLAVGLIQAVSTEADSLKIPGALSPLTPEDRIALGLALIGSARS